MKDIDIVYVPQSLYHSLGMSANIRNVNSFLTVLNDYIESWNYKLYKSFWNQNILLNSACQ